MSEKESSHIRIGLVGGGTFCKEFMEKTFSYGKRYTDGARIVAVADPDPESPGIAFARGRGLITVSDYQDLYDTEHRINLIIVLVQDEEVFDHILHTKPGHIRLLSNKVFRLLWNTVAMQEQELRERTEELVTILDGIQDFIVVITPEKKIVEVNQAFLRQMGYTRDEVIGRTCHEVFQSSTYPCESGEIACPLNEVVRNKRPNQQVLTRTDHNGERRFIELSIFPIWEKSGKILRFIEISRDITDRKREEEEITRRLEEMVEERTRQLKETHEKLLHQDKMASLGKLSASVVHEINNPIAGILNLLMLLRRIIKEGTVDGEEIQQFVQYLNLMETETRRIGRIVSNLLAFSRQSGMMVKQVDLNRVMEKTLFLNSNLLKINGIRVEKNLAGDLPRITGSEDQLQQVFMNLVSNAAEAMESSEKGALRIETEHSLKNNSILIRVQDSGVGIVKENLGTLFEPFFTTKKSGKGVGLGLSVVYGIVRDHNGSISVESEVGKGTTFEVEIPIDPQGTGRGKKD
ncbi:MAG: PAS domain-containing protein [Deltaproteobacteria bacterium]|nr:PAS domain-containing protein [Deltaproteobacteria bacterium]